MSYLEPKNFHSFYQDIRRGIHDPFQDQVFKLALTHEEPYLALDKSISDIIEIQPAGNYPKGGLLCSYKAFIPNTPSLELYLNDPPSLSTKWKTIGPFRYGVLYNSTAPKNAGLIFYVNFSERYNRALEVNNYNGDFQIYFPRDRGLLRIIGSQLYP